MNDHRKREALNHLAEQAIPDNLDLLPRVRARIGARAVAPAPSPIHLRRRLLVGATAAVLLVLAAAGASSFWNTATPVGAQAILDQAQTTSVSPMAAVRTYHLQLTRRVPGKGDVTINTEIWFGGADRQRSTDQTKDAGGAIVSASDIVFHGTQAWIAMTNQGHIQVIHTTGTTWNVPAEDPARQNSLTDVLAQYNNPKLCMNAVLQGEASIAGQATYVIAVTPKAGDCDAEGAKGAIDAKAQSGDPAKTVGAPADAKAQPGDKQKTDGAPGGVSNAAGDDKAQPGDKPKAGGAPSSARINVDHQVGQMLVWVDKLSFVPLKTEVRTPAGVLLDQTIVTSVEYNVPIPDSVFDYSPPAGASVFNFTGGTGADVKQALCAMPGDNPCRSSK